MRGRERDLARWPPDLAEFDADAWPPAPGELDESCRCSSCLERFGPPKPAPRTVAAARRRWRKARLATFRKGSYEYRAELLTSLQEALPERHKPNNECPPNNAPIGRGFLPQINQ